MPDRIAQMVEAMMHEGRSASFLIAIAATAAWVARVSTQRTAAGRWMEAVTAAVLAWAMAPSVAEAFKVPDVPVAVIACGIGQAALGAARETVASGDNIAGFFKRFLGIGGGKDGGGKSDERRDQ